jgi:hypothetical protein
LCAGALACFFWKASAVARRQVIRTTGGQVAVPELDSGASGQALTCLLGAGPLIRERSRRRAVTGAAGGLPMRNQRPRI